jgi:hypothetical protein
MVPKFTVGCPEDTKVSACTTWLNVVDCAESDTGSAAVQRRRSFNSCPRVVWFFIVCYVFTLQEWI